LRTFFSSTRNIIIVVVVFLAIAGLAIGLGVGLTQGSSSGSGASTSVGPAKLTQDQCATARRLCDSIASTDSVQGEQCRANLAQYGC
jgi:hypothetical protein